MAKFDIKSVTNAGRNLVVASLLEKRAIVFTHFEVGDGTLEGDPAELDQLVHKLFEVKISRAIKDPKIPGAVSVRASFVANEEMGNFYHRETGLYARLDGDDESVLFAYTNAGSTADYYSALTTDTWMQIDIVMPVVVGDAEVHYINDLGAMITLADLLDHEQNDDVHLQPDEKDALRKRGLLNGEIIPDVYFADWIANQPDSLYGVQYYNAEVNTSSAITSGDPKTHNNAGLKYTPSTDTTEGQDDYAKLPEFAWRYCNFVVDENGDPYPVALEGQDGFSLYDGHVGVIMRAFWVRDDVVASSYNNSTAKYSMRELEVSFCPRDGFKAFKDCRRADGSTAPYCIVPAFHLMRAEDGKLYSRAGSAPANFMSHNLLISELEKHGGGWTKYYARASHWQFGQIFGLLKMGTKNSQALLAGNTSNNRQLKASVQRSNNETWFPLSQTDAAYIEIGNSYSVGYGSKDGTAAAPAYNIDRGQSTIHAYANCVKCIGKEEVKSGSTVQYVKILLDTKQGFPTAAVDLDPVDNPGKWKSEILLSSMLSWNGETLDVIGRHDGSHGSNTDGRHSYRIQGAEYGIGAWVVIGDMLFDNIQVSTSAGTYASRVLYCPDGMERTANEDEIRSKYTYLATTPASATDYYIGDIKLDVEIGGFWPTSIVSASTQGWQDQYWNANADRMGLREFLVGGFLGHGARGGAASVSAGYALSPAYWYLVARG